MRRCLPCFPAVVLAVVLSSCATTAPRYDYRELARASLRLNMDIDLKDNHRLYVESAAVIGVPWRRGGTDERGLDCSGLTARLYRKVYRKRLRHNSEEQRVLDCRKVNRSNLLEGDLVFFHDGRNRHAASHVGIYLKNHRFLHASMRHGVIVSSLDEDYYRHHWLCGGRVLQ